MQTSLKPRDPESIMSLCISSPNVIEMWRMLYKLFIKNSIPLLSRKVTPLRVSTLKKHWGRVRKVISILIHDSECLAWGDTCLIQQLPLTVEGRHMKKIKIKILKVQNSDIYLHILHIKERDLNTVVAVKFFRKIDVQLYCLALFQLPSF